LRVQGSNQKPILEKLAKRLQELYSLDKVPGTFFYDNDKGKMELERENYDVPIMKEYRAPSMFFWKIYYKVITEYVKEHILD
jgi:hypothetical protein